MVQLKNIYILYMITLKLIIYSSILFILLVKLSSCQNNIIDLLNIILVITLFNLVLEKLMNTNIKENYDPIDDNNYSSVEVNNNKNKNNKYDFEEVDFEKKSNNIKENDSEDESEKDDSEQIESKDDEIKENTNKLEEMKETTNKIVNVIKDNVKNIIDNNIIKTDSKEREEPKLNNKFIYGYSYLHTDNWSIPEKKQPVCKNVNPCKICPNKTNGFNAHLLNYSNINNGK